MLFTIATKKECREILAEPRLLLMLGIELAELSSYVDSSTKTYFLVSHKSHRSLFTCEPVCGIPHTVYEIHFACPKDSIIASRFLFRGLLKRLFENCDAEAVITSCPEGKMANMCRKLGGEEIYRSGNKLYFLSRGDIK